MDKYYKELLETGKKGQLVKIDRKGVSKFPVEGFVVAVSSEFVIINALDDGMYLDGYIVIRCDDINCYYVRNRANTFAYRALQLKEIYPEKLQGISMDSLPNLLVSINRQYPLIVIRREIMSEDKCYIGRILKLTDKTITLDEISPAAKWEYARRYRFADITRIDFDGKYEEALWMVSEHERKKRKKKSRK